VELVIRLYIRSREWIVTDRNGQTLAEYSLVLACVAVALAGAFVLYGQNLNTAASGIDSSVINA
jgi:Flp pilus assembly pilin Flp